MIECPKCGNSNIVTSHRRGMEKIYRYFFPMVHYRCKECWYRFWKFQEPFKTPGFLLLSALCLIIIGVILYSALFSKKGAPPPPRVAVEHSGKEVTDVIKRMEKVAAKDVIPEPDYNGVGEPVKEPDTPPQDTAKVTEDTKAPEPPIEKKVVVPEAVPPKEVPAAKPVVKKEPPKKTPVKVSYRKMKSLKSLPKKGWVKISILADGPVDKFKSFSMGGETSPKIVVDLPGKWKNKSKSKWIVDSDLLKQVRIGEHSNKLRLVFDMKLGGVSKPRITKTQNGCDIFFRK